MLSNHGHLILRELLLPSSAEWVPDTSGWCILRLSGGVAYCFSAREAGEIQLTEVLVVPPGVSLRVRSSRIGPSQLHYFGFKPDLLGSLLTLNEREQFAWRANQAGEVPTRLPLSHPATQQFSAFCQLNQENPLQERAQLLALVAMILPPTAQDRIGKVKLNSHVHTPMRFLELIQSMAETELLNHSPAELAARCGCSARHFARLFRDHFGTSVRSKQTQLKLEKAQRLLAESDAKVLKVAFDVGYRHLGLFNALFKRHFGVTPTEWRRSQEKLHS